MRILKVAHIVEPYPEAGGFGTRVGMTARWLQQQGHQVTVVSTDCGPRSIEPARHDSPEMVYLSAALQYRRVGVGPAMFRFAKQRVAAFDVIHVYGNYSLLAPIIIRAARRRGIPHVFEPAGSLPPAVRGVTRKRAYMATLGRAVLRDAALVVATSQREYEQLAEIVPSERLVLRRNGVTPEAVLPESAAELRAGLTGGVDRKVVLFIGRICQVKALDILVDACSRVATPLVLTLAGPDDGDGTLQRVLRDAQRLGVDVRAIGPVDARRKWQLLAAADVLALTSHSESFGLAAAEAMAAALPVVVSTATGIAPWVEQAAAGCVVRTEPADIASALEALLSDPVLRATAGHNGRVAAAAHLGWDTPLELLEQLYERVAGNDPMPSLSAT